MGIYESRAEKGRVIRFYLKRQIIRLVEEKMIETPTVFILGAGASKPYGYPTGNELITQLCKDLDWEPPRISQSTSNPVTTVKTEIQHPESKTFRRIKEVGFLEGQIKEFRDALYYSGLSSIDEFLEHRAEKYFHDIGVLSIAMSLIPKESTEDLLDPSKDNDKTGRWYGYFYRRLQSSFDNFDKNKFSVITFNYDRSFEQFLFTAIKNTSGKTDAECAEKMKNIPIVHVYGKLGNLPWEGGEYTRGYEDRSDYVDIYKVGQGIKIIRDGVENSPEFKKAHELLEKAEKIYFLGFGYNSTNLKRLDITHHLSKKIAGTAYGMDEAERSIIYKIIPKESIHLDESSVHTAWFLKRKVPFD